MLSGYFIEIDLSQVILRSVVRRSSKFGSPSSLFARRIQDRKRSRVYQPHARRLQPAQCTLQFQKTRRPDLFYGGSEKAHAPSLATKPRGGVWWRTRGIECSVGCGYMRVWIKLFKQQQFVAADMGKNVFVAYAASMDKKPMDRAAPQYPYVPFDI